MKVVTIVGTRPEIIKLSEVIKLFDQYTEHTLIHTGQKYDKQLNEVFFSDLDLRVPDQYLGVVGDNLGDTIGNIISKSYEALANIMPDALLIYGDTNSCLSAISAKRLKIPVFHFEAGNRSFDENVPEEVNRRIVDHISDVNFPLTEHARDYLLAEGIPASRIIKTGGFMKEIINVHKVKIDGSDVLSQLGLAKGEYAIASIHREENVDNEANLARIIDCLHQVAVEFSKTVVFSCHPRTRKKLSDFNIEVPDSIQMLEPFGFLDYVHLQQHAFCILSDSGTITEEADILGVPAVTVRISHERPEGFDSGVLVMTGFDPKVTKAAVRMQVESMAGNSHRIAVDDYNVDRPSLTVLKAVFSYVDYVNRFVWRKHS